MRITTYPTRAEAIEREIVAPINAIDAIADEVIRHYSDEDIARMWDAAAEALAERPADRVSGATLRRGMTADELAGFALPEQAGYGLQPECALSNDRFLTVAN